MAATVFTSLLQLHDDSGDPLDGGSVTVYQDETTTLISLFSSDDLTGAAANPITLDAAGRHAMRYFTAESYKVLIKNSAGTTLYTRDNIDPSVPLGTGVLAVANGGTGASTAAAARTSLDVPSNADFSAFQASINATAASNRRVITATDTVVAGDIADLIEITSGTFTLAFTAAATLGNGFHVYIFNSGTGLVTLNPDGAELIDGLASWILYPGGVVCVYCSGTAFESVLLAPMTATFTTAGANTWTKPGCGLRARLRVRGGGASGGKGGATNRGGGGGGGSSVEADVALSTLGATETVTVATGGASQTVADTVGNVGGNTTFGSHATGFGGGGGGGDSSTSDGGFGGGIFAAGAAGTGGGATSNYDAGTLHEGGDGGEAVNAATGEAGGAAFNGGGGGGGAGGATAGGAGGDSKFGGDGGAGATGSGNATAGTAPGGGGGGSVTGNSGAGADGDCIVTVY